jgi:hypothetical protein
VLAGQSGSRSLMTPWKAEIARAETGTGAAFWAALFFRAASTRPVARLLLNSRLSARGHGASGYRALARPVPRQAQSIDADEVQGKRTVAQRGASPGHRWPGQSSESYQLKIVVIILISLDDGGLDRDGDGSP